MDKKTDSKVSWIIAIGWLFLVFSSTCFYISTRSLDSSSEVSYALWLIAARLFGIGAFMIGGFALLHQRWNSGTLLLIGSVTLPFVSLFIHGTI